MAKLLPIVLAGLLAAMLVAATLAGKLSCSWLVPLALAALVWRLARPRSNSSLFADSLLTIFGLALACLPVLGLAFLARQENHENCRRFDLSGLEQMSRPLPHFRKFQLCGSVYISAKERIYTRDYGWVQPIYSRRHPRFPGNRGPDQPPSFFLQLDRDHLDRLAHRFLPPAPQDGIRDFIYVRQTRTGFLQEQPGDLLVLPCLARARMLALCGTALFTLGLALLISNLGGQHRARYLKSRWDRPIGS